MAGHIPREFIDRLLERVDIVELINQRVPLKKQGREYSACCPFHHEKTPSFTVSPNKQFYHCFGCSAHGSALSFLMEYEHLDYVEAIEKLAAYLGMTVPYETQGGRIRPARKKDQSLIELMSAVAEHYTQNLTQAEDAKAYLKKRGLDEKTQALFGLGYAKDAWGQILDGFGPRFGHDKLQASGLLTQNEQGRVYDRFRGRLMFPIRNRRGDVIGFGGRLLGDGKPKYLNSPETELFHKGRELYGLYEARKNTRNLTRLLVVEGYMDVIALAQFGITYAVATLGTATTSGSAEEPMHIQQLFRAVPEIVFCFDGDRAGEQAAWKALETVLPELRDDRQVRFLFLPEKEDPDSYVRKIGNQAFSELIDKALPLSQFFISGLKKQLNLSANSTLNVPEERNRYLHETARLLQQMPDGMMKNHLTQELARLGNLDQNDRAVLVRKHRQQQNSDHYGEPPEFYKSNNSQPGLSTRTIQKTPLRYMIALLLHEPQWVKFLDNPDTMSQWEIPGLDLLLHIIEKIEEHPNINTASLFELLRETKHGPVVEKLINWNPQNNDEERLQKEFRDCLRQVKRQARQKTLESLLHKEQTTGLSVQEKHDLLSLLGEIHETSS